MKDTSTVKPETLVLLLAKPDLKNFDVEIVDEMLVKVLIFVLYCTFILLGGFTLKG